MIEKIPQERVSVHVVEQTLDLPVLQIMEEIVVVARLVSLLQHVVTVFHVMKDA